MYWSDANFVKIERAYLNGTERRTLLTEKVAWYSTFVHHDGSIYFTDKYYLYEFSCLLSPAAKLTG